MPRSRADQPVEPLRFRPIFKPTVWGGRRLERVLKKRLPGPGPYGESWEISDCGADRSVVDGGPWDQATLHDLVTRYPEAVLGRPGAEFPLLLKAIDAAAPLSVQVHPGEEDAVRLGPGFHGKTEAWVILEALPGSRIVYGLGEGVERETLFQTLESGNARAAASLLSAREVRSGDVIFLPAGTIHSIGAGILLLEVQTSSDLTYRIYDWGRAGLDGRPRKLHLGEARALTARPAPGRCPHASLTGQVRQVEPLVDCPQFRIEGLKLTPLRPRWRASTREGDRQGFAVLGGVSGRAAVFTSRGGNEAEVGPGDFLLIPAAAGDLEVRSRDGEFTGIWVRDRAPASR